MRMRSPAAQGNRCGIAGEAADFGGHWVLTKREAGKSYDCAAAAFRGVFRNIGAQQEIIAPCGDDAP
jgi:hypothetical protein